MFSNIYDKIASKVLDKKGLYIFGSNYGSSGDKFVHSNSASQYLIYYSEVAPVGDAINKIALEASQIDPILYKASKDEAFEPVKDHPFTKLLERPNYYQSWSSFCKEYCIHNKSTGNNYVYLTGPIDQSLVKPPAEIFNLRPDEISYTTIDPDGTAGSYQYSKDGVNLHFKKRSVRDAQGKRVDAYIETHGNGQLYHFKEASINPIAANQIYGDSPLRDCALEIDQYYQASVHNDSLLRRGLTAKKLISVDSPSFGQQQKDRLKEFVEQEFSGSQNAGKSIVSPLPLRVEDLEMNLKDMDFKSLMERTSHTVYRKFNIPLPMVDTSKTSNSNMTESKLNLYDNAVLPFLNDMLDNLFLFVFTERYRDADQFSKLSYDAASIQALMPRRSETLKVLKESGVITINELREYQSLDRIKGGDTLYVNSNQVPIGIDINTTDTVGVANPQPIDEEEVDEDIKMIGQKSTDEYRDILRELLEKQKKVDGTPFFDEKQIEDALNG